MSVESLTEVPSTESKPLKDGHDDRPEFKASKPHSRRFGTVVTVLVGLITIAAGSGFFLKDALSLSDRQKFVTHTISRGDLRVSVIEQGTLESSNNTEITCKIRGYSTVTWVIDGGLTVQPGDELVRLDTKVIEEQLSLTKTNTFAAKSTLERTRADLEQAKISVEAYPNGRYRSQLESLQQQLEIAKSNLNTSQKMLDQSKQLFRKGYIDKLDIDANAFTVEQAQLELEVVEKQIEVLENYTSKMQMETLQGNLRASESKLKSDEAALKMELSRQKRAEQELADCVITAPRAGLVIFPSAAAWKETPDISQGARVRKDQVLLLMPDLDQMQVKVGIHESVIDRIEPGVPAVVTIADTSLGASVTSVSAVTRPAGWWTGNVVKYDTIIKLPAGNGLKPGMSAEVEVVLAEHTNVLTIPVAAVIETEQGDFCWVVTDKGPQKRLLQLGDTDDVSILVEAGLNEGEQVVLNPAAHIKDAEEASRNTIDKTARDKPDENDTSELESAIE